GREVILFERADIPHDKACGEGVMPSGVGALERLGVRVDGAIFEGVRYHVGAMHAPGRFPESGCGLGVRRTELSSALLNTAGGAPGVRIAAHTAVQAPLIENGRVAGVVTDRGEFRARLVVGADGVQSILRHKLGWDIPIPARRFGLRAHYRLAGRRQPEPWVDIFFGQGHEVYVTPLPHGEVLVALLVDGSPRTARLDEVIASQPALAGMLAGAVPSRDTLGVAPLCVQARRRWAPGIVLLGDAAGNCDPITGAGMSQGLLSAELLAGRLSRRFPPSEEDLERFDAQRERMLADCRRLTAVLLSLARRPALAPVVLRILEAWPALFSHLVGVAAGVRPLFPRPRSAAA
ncbi:MAG: NAD(P)/FAD-dependent oxidoreductase, partial [Bryobacteraceae bacterium]